MTEPDPLPSSTSDNLPPAAAPPQLFHPDSPVVATAQELFVAHGQQAEGACPRCGRPAPCPVATHAMQVCQAAGVPARPDMSRPKRKSTKPAKKKVASGDVVSRSTETIDRAGSGATSRRPNRAKPGG